MGLDAVVWPCKTDVGKTDADINEESAKHAWLNGVLYSNGNCAIRQFGIPTVSVPMGVMTDIGMPVNLTFASKAYNDNNLFRYAYAFEKHSQLRQSQSRTPELETDTISRRGSASQMGLSAPQLRIETSASIIDGQKVITVSGMIGEQEVSELKVYVDGEEMKSVKIVDGRWEVKSKLDEPTRARPEEISVPDFKSAMVIVVATGKNRRSTAKMAFV
ncbi:hypothetical protein FSST1_010280 [Fusarium sambucinum]